MINMILCGGAGTRLWPLSRTMLPKQFVRLFDDSSLFQKTLQRNAPLCSRAFVISNAEQYFLAVDQLGSLPRGAVQVANATFLLEPVGRNTAPAIALACLALDADDLVLVTPSDHLVRDQHAYEEAVGRAKALAEQGALVTFGIEPTYPETGFGYIEARGNDVLSFTEKPDHDTAGSYLERGNYYWNSGMFCFKAGVFLAELQTHAPLLYSACCTAMEGHAPSEQLIRIAVEAMQAIPADSIDYAVMEKSARVKVVPAAMGWSDLGSFDALYAEEKKADQDNALLCHNDADCAPVCIDSRNNLLVTGGRKVALIDVEDLLVVDTDDALLIARKGSSQKVKQVVEQIRKSNPELGDCHRITHRPWGTYEVLLAAAQYKIKRIVVKPGSKLSLQKHFHRNEHWIVVSGTATVTVGADTCIVRPNESTYIQMGEVHRLENQGKIDLVMIEVQVGEYTGEDDIVRLEDNYGR